jgi:stringent starvation protein B
MSETSTKPYMIRAIHEWCTDNGFRPYLAVSVDSRTVVPMEFVRDDEIVLNVSADATNRLRLGNELIEFEARFNQVAREISIPVDNVSAIYAAENGQGMAFEVTAPAAQGSSDDPSADAGPADRIKRAPALLSAVPAASEAAQPPDEDPPPTGRPRLTRIK